MRTVQSKGRRSYLFSVEAAPKLQRESFVPLYFQLAATLEEVIESGRWQPGDRFASESQLCAQFNVSRAVVRPAVAILEGEGRLVQLKGKGIFVGAPKVSIGIGGLTRLLGNVPVEGLVLRIVDVSVSQPAPEIKGALRIQGRDLVAHITAVLIMKQRPICLCYSFISVAAAGWVLPLVKGHRHLEDWMPPQRDGAPVAAEIMVETSACSQFEAEQLTSSPGMPLLMARCMEFIKAPREKPPFRPVEIAWLMYRADAARLAISSNQPAVLIEQGPLSIHRPTVLTGRVH